MKDLIYLEGAEGMEKLASYAVARNLIPFFGAGFPQVQKLLMEAFQIVPQHRNI